MLILSLDTSTRTGSAAIVRDGTVIQEIAGNGTATHGERLPADLMTLLDAAAVGLHEVDLFAVAAGPGSFTGLRVGIATIQGLAVAEGRLVVPISTLEALARSAARDGRPVAAWMDAQRGEVFASLYAPDGRSVLIEPTSAPPEATLTAWRSAADLGGAIFAGDGALRYRDRIAAVLPDAAVEAPSGLAGVIGRIASAEPERAVRPHAVVPVYIRRSDAELARDRRRTLDQT
jgi:tRNA threonylcarbamoyladenosine biosynthesis protein TsaB